MRAKTLFYVAIFLIALPAAQLRAASAEFAFQDHPRGGQWELLAVRAQIPAGGGTISIQDARGGLTVSRPLTAATDPATGEAKMLLPLPFLGPAELPPDAWPLDITVTSPSGATDRRRIDVPRSGAIAAIGGAATESLRVALPAAADELAPRAARQLPWDKVSPSPPVFLDMSEEDILSGPPLEFAACDAVLISDSLAPRLTADRIAALLNAGVRIATARDPATAQNPILAHLAWQRVQAGDQPALWIMAPSSYPRPKVLEPEWGTSRPALLEAAPMRSTRAIVLLVPLAGILIVLLARGLFRGKAAALGAMALGVAGLTLGAAALLQSSAPPLLRRAAWTSTTQSSSATVLSVAESFTAYSPLFAHHLQAAADQNSFLFPIAVSLRQYFAQNAAVLTLDIPSDNGLNRISHLEIPLRPRQTIVYALRSAALNPADFDTTHGQWIDAGYISPAGAPTEKQEPELLTQWASDHPGIADSLLAWYELRFAPTHRYFLKTQNPGEPIAILDFGESPAAPPP